MSLLVLKFCWWPCPKEAPSLTSVGRELQGPSLSTVPLANSQETTLSLTGYVPVGVEIRNLLQDNCVLWEVLGEASQN